MAAARAIRRAIENQVSGLGFSLVEVLSPCPTIWNMDPVQAQRWVREEMARVFPPGVYRDRTKDAQARPAPPPPPALEEIPRILDITNGRAEALPGAVPAGAFPGSDFRIKVAGFGGQGVLLLGELLAEAGLAAGLHVSWLPSYGPEMRSGTSNCHVRLSAKPVDCPLVSRPNVLLALNEPSLRKFLPGVEPGGWVFYNGDALPDDCRRPDLKLLVRPFVKLADALGSAKAGNIVMLGAFLGAANSLPRGLVESVLRSRIRSDRLLDIDLKALTQGLECAAKGETS